MKLNSSKIQKLIAQYPFVSDILSIPMEPYDGIGRVSVDAITIRVEKADGDLMYRRADNVGLGDSSCIMPLSGPREGQVMRRGEYLFAVDGNGGIANRMAWPRNDEVRRQLGYEVYGKHVLWKERTFFRNGEPGYTNPIWDEVKYLVWVTVEAWHVDTMNADVSGTRFGEFKDRSISITIYGRPSQGFEALEKESSVYENLRLDTRLMTRGAIDKDHDFVTMGGMLYEMCVTFQDEVYFNGMKETLDTGKYRGASGRFGSVKVLCAESCGYNRITLEDPTSYVTFQLRPESENLYVLGQEGTLPQIRNLVRTVVRMWRENPESRAAFNSDSNVSVM